MKLKLVGIFVCLLAGFFISCGSIPKCADDYTYVGGKCVLRPADQPPDLYSNSQSAVNEWNAKQKQQEANRPPDSNSRSVANRWYPKVPKVDAKNYQIAWWANDVVGAEEAKKSKMPMYVLITYTDEKYCDPCRKMDDTLNDIRVIELLNKKFVCVKINIHDDAMKKYKIRGYPANFFLNYDGTHIGRRSGYVKTSEEFTKLLNKVLSLAKE